jgi:hypothetical protein
VLGDSASTPEEKIEIATNLGRFGKIWENLGKFGNLGTFPKFQKIMITSHEPETSQPEADNSNHQYYLM